MNIYKVREDLEGNGESSDFWNISEELRTAEVGWVKKYHFFRKPSISTSWHSKVSELLFVHDQKKIYGTEFLICTTQVPGILWTKTKTETKTKTSEIYLLWSKLCTACNLFFSDPYVNSVNKFIGLISECLKWLHPSCCFCCGCGWCWWRWRWGTKER